MHGGQRKRNQECMENSRIRHAIDNNLVKINFKKGKLLKKTKKSDRESTLQSIGSKIFWARKTLSGKMDQLHLKRLVREWDLLISQRMDC